MPERLAVQAEGEATEGVGVDVVKAAVAVAAIIGVVFWVLVILAKRQERP